jgi:hypothetical protein
VAVGLVRAHRQAGVDHEHAPLCPGDEKAAVVGGCDEVGVTLFDALVDVDEGGGCACGWSDGEAEAVGLVVVVVGVLANYYCFDGVEGGVSGPDDVVVLLGLDETARDSFGSN